MLVNNTFKEVFIDPALEGSDQLKIVSGYATSSMLTYHLEQIESEENLDHGIKIELIIGMVPKDGIRDSDHELFKEITNFGKFGSELECKYVTSNCPVHAKVYCWYNGPKPTHAFAGSANYTMNGIICKLQIEYITKTDPVEIDKFISDIQKFTTNCTEDGIESSVKIKDSLSSISHPPLAKADSVVLSLLDSRTGETPENSGINWGQRDNRDRNQAYIPIPSKIYKGDFFPEIGNHFTVKSDDGQSFIFARRQEKGKALHTPESNAILGKYLRNRIGVQSGAYVHTKDLKKYGRTDITFYKVDSEFYLMDFSKNNKLKK